MELKDCFPHLIYEFKTEHELLRAIEELSVKFTTQRENISDYLSDRKLVSAYTAFYLTTNIPKLVEVLKWMPQEWLDIIKTLPLIDMGAGPGTFSLAWKELFPEAKVQQWEKSGLMKEQARKLWDGLHKSDELIQLARLSKQHESVMLFGHSANEMGSELTLKFIQEVQPDHLLFIEPGTKTFFPQMLDIRRSLIKSGYQVLFPCPAKLECPMAQSVNDWCHQFIQVEQSAEVERLSQILKKDRRLLPLTVHAYSKTFNHQDRERIVRVLPDSKFSYEWEMCLGDKLDHYQVFKRGMDKKTQKEIDRVLAGAAIESEIDKFLEGSKRVKLVKIKNKLV